MCRSGRSGKVTTSRSRSGNFSHCLQRIKIYDKISPGGLKISSDELISEFLQNSGCAKNMHKKYDIMLLCTDYDGEIIVVCALFTTNVFFFT